VVQLGCEGVAPWQVVGVLQPKNINVVFEPNRQGQAISTFNNWTWEGWMENITSIAKAILALFVVMMIRKQCLEVFTETAGRL
jgi:hypothetical protein